MRVANRYDRIVERGMDVRDARLNVLYFAFPARLRLLLGSQNLSRFTT
jgi:hypothetical protein